MNLLDPEIVVPVVLGLLGLGTGGGYAVGKRGEQPVSRKDFEKFQAWLVAELAPLKEFMDRTKMRKEIRAEIKVEMAEEAAEAEPAE